MTHTRALAVLAIVWSALGATPPPPPPPPPPPNVTMQITHSGCLLLKPDRPFTFRLVNMRDAGDDTYRTIAPARSYLASLKPGYYYVSISTPRCWRTQQRFVVGQGMRRSLVVYSGTALEAPTNGEVEVLEVYYVKTSGVVLHTATGVTKVSVSTPDSDIQLATRAGNIWYLDDARAGYATIRLYAGRRLVKTDHALLRSRGFFERFYPAF